MPDLDHGLAARLDLYTALFGFADDAIMAIDLAGTVTAWNAAAEQVYGLRAANVLGRCLYDFVKPHLAAATRANVERIARGETIKLPNAAWPGPDGQPRLLALNFFPLCDAAGQVTGVASFARDITEQLRAEEALRASERQYRMLADNASDLIVTRDANWDVIYVSPSVAHILGYTPAEVAALPIDALFGPGETPAVLQTKEMLNALAATDQPIPVVRRERVFRHKNGSLVTLGVAISGLYDAAGEFAGFITIGRDVTALKATEQALRAANAGLEQRVAERTAELSILVAQLKQADAAKDAFLAAVSHELRTPLTGVLTLAEMLAAQVPGTLNERQLHYVQSIETSGERLLEIVNSILHYTQLVAGVQPAGVQPAGVQPGGAQPGGEPAGVGVPCRLFDLGAAGVRALRPKAERKQQAVELDVEPATLAITGHPDGILKVLAALLDNAVKFTPAGGRLGVRMRPLLAGERGAGNRGVTIEVWDTGIGIAAEQLPLLFQPFTQLDQRLAREYEGLGLGLAAVKHQVAAMGGSVEVHSVLGAGSRFVVTLPPGA